MKQIRRRVQGAQVAVQAQWIDRAGNDLAA